MDVKLKNFRDWHQSGSSAYEANQHFMNSLRKYPDSEKYNYLVERLLRYTQNKHFNKTFNKLSKPSEGNSSSKRTQTFQSNSLNIDSVLSGIVTDYNNFKHINQYNESYDYLNASRGERSGVWSSPVLDARYSYDLKRYIKKKLRQICEEAVPYGCNEQRSGYERHCTEHHSGGPCINEQTYRCYHVGNGQRRKSHISKTNILNSSNVDIIQKVEDWTSKLPIFPDDSSENKLKRNTLNNKLANDITKLKEENTSDDFIDKSKAIIKNLLNEYPMWTPENVEQKEVFINNLVEDFVQKLKLVTIEAKDLSSETHDTEDDILNILEDITNSSNVNKDKLLKEVLEKLKPQAKQPAVDSNKYKEELKTQAINILQEVTKENDLNSKDEMIKNLAQKLTSYLSVIRRQKSNSSQTDYEADKEIDHNSNRKLDGHITFQSNAENNHIIDTSNIFETTNNGEETINRKSSDLKEAEQNNTIKEYNDIRKLGKTHSSQSLSRSYSRLAVDGLGLEDADIVEEIKVPSKKTSAKLSHKRWVKRDSKNKSKRDLSSSNSTELDDTDYSEETVGKKSKTIQANEESKENTFLSTHLEEDETKSSSVTETNDSIIAKSFTPLTNETDETLPHPNTKLTEAIQHWIDKLPVNLDITMASLAQDLTTDDEFIQKFKDIKPENLGNDVDALKYYVFKRLCKVLGTEELAQVINEVDNLMQQLENIDSNENYFSENRESSAKNVNTNEEEKQFDSTEEEQNYIPTNIDNVVNKNNMRHTDSSLTHEDLVLLEKIRERSGTPEKSYIDDISKEIDKNNENTQTIQQGYTSFETQTSYTIEKSSQIDETTANTSSKGVTNADGSKNVPYYRKKFESDKLAESFKFFITKEKDLKFQNEEGNQSETTRFDESREYCEYCRLKHEATKRCKRLKRKLCCDNNDANEDYIVFCPKCGTKCPYPSLIYFS